jgi:hypothetical protein
MKLHNCKVKIIVNEELSFFQKIYWKFKEWMIKSAITNKDAKGITVEDALLGSNLLKSESEYLVHTSIFPQKYEIKDKKKDKEAKEKKKHYVPRITIYVMYEVT